MDRSSHTPSKCQKFGGSVGGSFHFKARFGALPLNFENVVFSMRDFTYVKFLQFFFLEKYLTFI